MTTTSSNINIYGGSRILTKQEEIREGIAEQFWYKIRPFVPSTLWDTEWADLTGKYREESLMFARQAIEELHSQGVVIKVDSDAESIARLLDSNRPFAVRFIKELKDKAGYVAVEEI